MKVRYPRPFRTLLVVLSGLWLAVAPAMPGLHIAFASHRHVFCLEHHRIEDAGPKRVGLAPSRPLGSTETRGVWVGATPPGGVDARPACAFSNFVVQLAFAPSAPSLALRATFLPEQRVELLDGSANEPVELILIAPKQSPPLVS